MKRFGVGSSMWAHFKGKDNTKMFILKRGQLREGNESNVLG
jgi:hypothetical protein